MSVFCTGWSGRDCETLTENCSDIITRHHKNNTSDIYRRTKELTQTSCIAQVRFSASLKNPTTLLGQNARQLQHPSGRRYLSLFTRVWGTLHPVPHTPKKPHPCGNEGHCPLCPGVPRTFTDAPASCLSPWVERYPERGSCSACTSVLYSCRGMTCSAASIV